MTRLKRINLSGCVYHTAPFAYAGDYGNARRYVYNGAQMFAEYFNSSGELLKEQFVYGTYLDEVWARQRMIPNGSGGYNPQHLFFHHDPIYSVCGITDLYGNLFEAYEYDPYGKRTVITDGPDPDGIVNFTTDDLRGADSPLFVKPAFTGQRYDLESGLYYYKERYYHPNWGRFVIRDNVIHFNPINLYLYADGSPIYKVDPSGNITIDFAYGYKDKGYYSGGDYVLQRNENLSIVGVDGVATHNVSVKCSCKCPEGSKKYRPIYCKVTHIIRVTLPYKFNTTDGEELAKQAEFDHVRDYTDTWADKTANALIWFLKGELDKSKYTYKNKSKCEKKSSDTIYKKLHSSANEAMADSKRTWDIFGPHKDPELYREWIKNEGKKKLPEWMNK